MGVMFAYYMQWDGENPLLIGFIGLSGLMLTAYFKRYDHTVLDVADENGKNHIVLNLSTIVNFVFLLMIFLIVYDARADYIAARVISNGVFNIEI
jgi:hypothetical protein